MEEDEEEEVEAALEVLLLEEGAMTADEQEVEEGSAEGSCLSMESAREQGVAEAEVEVKGGGRGCCIRNDLEFPRDRPRSVLTWACFSPNYFPLSVSCCFPDSALSSKGAQEREEKREEKVHFAARLGARKKIL